MENLTLPHSKLFHYVGKMYKQGLISDNEKFTLKGNLWEANLELIINEKIDCFHYLESYEISKDDALFQE